MLFCKDYWRTDNHHSACMMIVRNLGWGLPLEMFNENPDLKKKIKIMELYDFTPDLEYYVDLVWSRESDFGAVARFLIEHIRTQRQLNNK